MAAENYHLKWDSHLSYLNTSIATLYKNEKFADVMLYSSFSNSSINSDIPTVGISAHKFILSSCSQFFATMFETAPITAPNGVLYIVLPPDLSHRAIQILVQYMYSGEATVSNDILNEVLRGGEILKIRGLCRSGSSSGGGSGSSHGHHLHHQREPSAIYVSNGTRSSLAPPPPMSTQLPADIYSNKPGSSNSGSARYTLDHLHTNSHQPQQQQHLHHHHHQQFRGLGASVMPKDSPVIVKSPKIATHTGLLSVASSSKLHGISVNKEVAIDPEDKCCYAAATQLESLPQSTATATDAATPPPPPPHPPPPPPGMSICTEVGCNSCPLAAPSNESADSALRRSEYDRDREEPLCDRERDDLGLVYERRLRRERSCERAPAHEYFDGPHYEQHMVKSYEVSVAPRLTTPPQHPHSFLTIKQEPTDWSNNPTSLSLSNDSHHEHSQETPLSPKQPLDFKINNVKLEASATPPDDSEEHTLRDYNNFKLLVCEICQKSFEDTKMLVRHLGTHAVEPAIVGPSACPGSSSSSSNATASSNLALRALKTYVPKKRRRVSQQENNMDHVTLLCDLCSTSFETPAEWVRHMNSQHTEIELAMFNSKKEGEQKGNNNSGASTASVTQMQATASKKYINANRPGGQSLLSSRSSSNNGNGAATATTAASPGSLAVVASSSQA